MSSAEMLTGGWGKQKKFPPHQPVVKKKLLVGILKQLDGHGQQLIWYRQK